MAKAAFYPKANRAAQWYGDTHPGVRFSKVRAIVWHTTEGGYGWPAYEGGGYAPHLTCMPQPATRTLTWRQHYRLDESSRALRNLPGGVDTNTTGVVQVELAGTCVRASGSRKQGPGYLWPEADDWALQGLADFSQFMHDEWGVPLTDEGRSWHPYGGPSDRLGNAAWMKVAGHVGHRHIPEQDHEDPGDLNVRRILALAHGQETDDMTPEDWQRIQTMLDATAGKAASAIHSQQIYRYTWTDGTGKERPLTFADAVLSAARKQFPAPGEIAAALVPVVVQQLSAALAKTPIGPGVGIDDAAVKRIAVATVEELHGRLAQ